MTNTQLLSAFAPIAPLLQEGAVASVLARYDEHGRAYHNQTHLAELLGLFSEYRHQLQNPNNVLLAILFHDAVYNPKAADNEQQSAALFASLLRNPADACLVPVQAMIMATAGHALTTPNADADLFLSMDLAILGAEPKRFWQYEGQIRYEFAHVPDAAYRAGRAAIMGKLAARTPLYAAPALESRFGAQARQNLADLHIYLTQAPRLLMWVRTPSTERPQP